MSASIFALKLRDASFKGVPFNVASISKSVLRRKVVHEYPQRDEHYVEDLGKGVTSYDLTAFLVGDNCVEKAKKLEEVLLSPGPGTFINPWEGSLNVTVLDASSITYSNDALRYCSVRIKFIDAGKLTNPDSSVDQTQTARAIADALGLATIEKFVQDFRESKFFEIYQSALNGTILEKINIISNSDLARIFDITDEIIELGANAAYLLGAGPRNFAEHVFDVLGLARFTTTKTRWNGVVDQITSIVSEDSFNSATKAKINEPAVASNIESDLITNQASIEGLMRTALITQAIGASTMIGSPVDTELETEASDDGATTETTASQVAVEDLLTTRDRLLTVIDNELRNPLISDEMFINLLSSRCAVFSLLTEKAEGLSRLITIDLPVNAPSLVVASDYYDDATREAEIVTRNKVMHAGFCPDELKILSK